eukprot:2237560-Amphidinium_carterae.2
MPQARGTSSYCSPRGMPEQLAVQSRPGLSVQLPGPVDCASATWIAVLVQIAPTVVCKVMCTNVYQ